MSDAAHHQKFKTPSTWITRFAPLVAMDGPAGGRVLDLAAGGGRHARHFLERGHPVTAADKDVSALADLARAARAEVVDIDLEDGSPWPFPPAAFAAIVVSNYLYRPHIEGLVGSLAPGGVLLYETFARGNEAFGRPRNPDHLLRSGELIDLVRERLQIVAYEHGQTDEAPPGVKQRICAVNDLGLSTRDDGEPSPHSLMPQPS
ncbi:MAG: methyltransferase domain-containing protein [Rhodospirillales bacterium]